MVPFVWLVWASLRVRHLAAAGAVRAPGQWEVVLAASVIATVPMLFIFFLGQRYFVEGIATTGRKG
jgi:ABC-type glycerol-3-phosphate transport system permease component